MLNRRQAFSRVASASLFYAAGTAGALSDQAFGFGSDDDLGVAHRNESRV